MRTHSLENKVVMELMEWFQCPRCHICIEKNGGCNHMQCYNCKHDFCWMCLGDWKSHGSEYYECSRYKENPNIANESIHAQAREALKKYLHYYERVSYQVKLVFCLNKLKCVLCLPSPVVIWRCNHQICLVCCKILYLRTVVVQNVQIGWIKTEVW